MDVLVLALGPAFAAGFAVQQLLELLDPFIKKEDKEKQRLFSGIAIGLGFILVVLLGLRVLDPLGVVAPEFIPKIVVTILDVFVTILVISAGTEGLNSILKFLGYAKPK